MIDSGCGPNRVFKISELSRLITNQLIPTNNKSAVNLARVCRHLEEPVLSILWATQSSLRTLLDVLPEENWRRGLMELCAIDANVVRGLDLQFGRSDAEVPRVISVRDLGGSITRDLEQGPTLCVLDARAPLGLDVWPCG